jgi:hypothetical protein
MPISNTVRLETPPAPRKGGLTGGDSVRSPEAPYPEPGWTLDLTYEFIEVWLGDWYLRAPEEPALEQQMHEFCAQVAGVRADVYTAALVADLELLEVAGY